LKRLRGKLKVKEEIFYYILGGISMPTLTGEDLEQVIRIVREIVKQEIDTKLPIHKEILDLKSVVKELAEAQKRTEESLRELTLVVRDLQRQVGGIAHAEEFAISKGIKVYYSYDFEPIY
jgi:hypothetical protein